MLALLGPVVDPRVPAGPVGQRVRFLAALHPAAAAAHHEAIEGGALRQRRMQLVDVPLVMPPEHVPVPAWIGDALEDQEGLARKEELASVIRIVADDGLEEAGRALGSIAGRRTGRGLGRSGIVLTRNGGPLLRGDRGGEQGERNRQQRTPHSVTSKTSGERVRYSASMCSTRSSRKVCICAPPGVLSGASV